MAAFTPEQVKAEARRQYGHPICINLMDEAMQEDTLEEAVLVIVMDSAYWDGRFEEMFLKDNTSS